jgi:hypothetical protein
MTKTYCSYCGSEQDHTTTVQGDAEIKQCCVCGHIDVMAHIPDGDTYEDALEGALIRVDEKMIDRMLAHR